MGTGERKAPEIAICGTRGIPARYGGFETFAEELSRRLVTRGYRVTVYGRKHFAEENLDSYCGVRLIFLSAPRHKYFETVVHTFLSLCHLCLERIRGKSDVSVVIVCNAANAPVCWIPRLFGMSVFVNVDGIERMRAKWNALGRIWYRIGERCAMLFATRPVSDAEVIRQYYLAEYGRDSAVIPYGFRETYREEVRAKLSGALGADAFLPEGEFFESHGIIPGKYILYTSRLEPENNAHIVLEAYRLLVSRISGGPKLVIVGDAPYAQNYIDSLHRAAGEGVIFTGFQFGRRYELLQLGALLYVQATEVGGTHPALVEAMGYGNCCIANGTPENEEVVGDAGSIYQKNSAADLAERFQYFIENPRKIEECRHLALARAERNYTWDKVTSAYEALVAGVDSSGEIIDFRRKTA